MRLTFKIEEARRAAEVWPQFANALSVAVVDGELVTVELPSEPPGPAIAHREQGPGTELKRLLERAGLSASGCQCDARAAEMDARGCAWCLANINTIVGWLRESADARGLPFPPVGAWLLVRAAIAAARRKAGVDTAADAE